MNDHPVPRVWPPTHRPLRLMFVAGEESGDRLGAALIRALRARLPAGLEVSGVGGAEMAREGVASLIPIDALSIVGFSAIATQVPTLLRMIERAAAAVVTSQPDGLIIIDSPEFTHRVAKRVRASAPQIPIIDYVSPSVWAWRPWRARSMRRYVDHVLALLPFEPEAHQRLGGPPCTYVGHPLIEEIATLRPNADEQRRREADPPVLLVLPGSRGGEIANMAGVFGETLGRLNQQVGSYEVVAPTVPRLAQRVAEAVKTWPVPVSIVTGSGERRAAMRTARAALAKSGTVTLELALAQVPMVAAYRVSLPEFLVAKAMINAPSAILANLVLGENAVPEFLQYEATAEKLAGALTPLLSDTPARERQLAAFRRLDAAMEIGVSVPANRAAEVVLETLSAAQPGFAETGANRLGSPRP